MQPDQTDWTRWIEILGRDDVTEQELRDFEAALKKAPGNQREYLQALADEVALELEHPLPSPIPSLDSLSEKPAHVSERNILRWISPIAAGVAIALVLTYFLNTKRFNSEDSASHAVATQESNEILATVTDTNDVADASGFKIGGFLKKGRINLPDGAQIGIAMRGGARLELNGPASLSIDSATLVSLNKGRIQTYAPKYARGFTIDTHDGRIVDLGTRFVTATEGRKGERGTEIHVLKGLVTAGSLTTGNSSQKESAPVARIKAREAVVLKDGKITPTDFLAHRLKIPLNPELPDSDRDGVPDSIEHYYGTNPHDAQSMPQLLRIAESFSNYQAGVMSRKKYQGVGKIAYWQGSGQILENGLNYIRNGKQLNTSGGCLMSSGVIGAGAAIQIDEKELPKDGSLFISFLMQLPSKPAKAPFGGLLLYLGDYKEQLFCGKISVAQSFGARMAESSKQDAFHVPADAQTHLFVIRIDQTRQITDVFLDPDLDTMSASPDKRYQNTVQFDRIILRSGSDSEIYPVKFDEIRVGLTWRSVLPIQ